MRFAEFIIQSEWKLLREAWESLQQRPPETPEEEYQRLQDLLMRLYQFSKYQKLPMVDAAMQDVKDRLRRLRLQLKMTWSRPARTPVS